MTSSPSWITVSPSAPAEGIIERRAARLAQGAPRQSRASHLGNIQTALLRRITPATTFALDGAAQEGLHPLVDLAAQSRDLAFGDALHPHGPYQIIDRAG